jgi:hypothetical protein
MAEDQDRKAREAKGDSSRSAVLTFASYYLMMEQNTSHWPLNRERTVQQSHSSPVEPDNSWTIFGNVAEQLQRNTQRQDSQRVHSQLNHRAVELIAGNCLHREARANRENSARR